MRKFNKREQEIIKKLVKYYQDNHNLSTVSLFLSDKIVGEDLKIVIRDDENYIVYCKEEDRKSSLYEVVEILNLFRYLVDDHLIALLPAPVEGMFIISNTQMNMRLGTGEKVIVFENNDYIYKDDNCWYDEKKQLKYVCITMTEKQFNIKDFIASVPVISPELDFLVKNNFKTMEEKTLGITRFAAGVSFLAFLSAIILPFFTRTKISEEQYNGSLNTIQEVEQTILNSAVQLTSAIDSSVIQITNAIDSIVIKEKKSSKK